MSSNASARYKFGTALLPDTNDKNGPVVHIADRSTGFVDGPPVPACARDHDSPSSKIPAAHSQPQRSQRALASGVIDTRTGESLAPKPHRDAVRSPPLESSTGHWNCSLTQNQHESSPFSLRRDSIPIASGCQTASFKSLYQKRSGGPGSACSRTVPRRSVSDTALRLLDSSARLRGGNGCTAPIPEFRITSHPIRSTPRRGNRTHSLPFRCPLGAEGQVTRPTR